MTFCPRHIPLSLYTRRTTIEKNIDRDTLVSQYIAALGFIRASARPIISTEKIPCKVIRHCHTARAPPQSEKLRRGWEGVKVLTPHYRTAHMVNKVSPLSSWPIDFWHLMRGQQHIMSNKALTLMVYHPADDVASPDFSIWLNDPTYIERKRCTWKKRGSWLME